MNGCELGNKCRIKDLKLKKPDSVFCNVLQNSGKEHTNSSFCCNKDSTERTCEAYQNLFLSANAETLPTNIRKVLDHKFCFSGCCDALDFITYYRKLLLSIGLIVQQDSYV